MPEPGYGSSSTTRSSGIGSYGGGYDNDSDSSSNSYGSGIDTCSLAGIEALSKQPSTEERLREGPAGGPTQHSMASSYSGGQTNDSANLTPLAGPAAMAARREFSHVPFRTQNAYQAYQGLTGNDFAGPTDMRLQQLSNATVTQNEAMQGVLRQSFEGTDAFVSGREKSPFSTFGKLQETAGSTVGDIKDLSGLRVEVDPIRPGFVDVYDAQAATQSALGDNMVIKQDYIETPNRWGYTGRVHSTLADANGLTHEVQVGTRDITSFIDSNVTNGAGDRISLHDATGYKGQIYGVELPDNLAKGYTDIIGEIKDVNGLGQTVSQTPELQDDITAYRALVEDALPERITTPAPVISTRARIGNVAGQGMGVLGLVGSGFQATNGVQTLASGGDTVVGVADVSAGTTGLVSGGALMTGRVALGTTTGGAVAVIDGAKDIYVGVRDGNVEQAVVGTVKAGAGTAMLAGVATANPVLIAGGAVVYAGAVVYESRDAIKSGVQSAGGWVKSWFD